MKKKIVTVAGIMIMIIGVICGAMDISAMTEAEADAACGNLPSVSGPAQGNTIKCKMDQPASAQCKSVGGTFTGKEGNYYICLIPFSSGSSGGSASISEEMKKRKEACEAKGGTYSASVSGGYISDHCTADSQDNTTLPDDSAGDGSDDGGSDADAGGSGVTWNTDNSSAKGDSKCGNGEVYTNFFGGCVSADNSSVFMVLNVILQVLTWGIGIAGTVGIVITGFQYMTARDDVTQMTKAKNRLIQIVIGLAIYAVMWAFLQWLLPGGVFGS